MTTSSGSQLGLHDTAGNLSLKRSSSLNQSSSQSDGQSIGQSATNGDGRRSTHCGSVLSPVTKMAAAAALQESPEWDLPRLRSSFGFEVGQHPKSRKKTRTKSRLPLKRPSSRVQDDYRHLKSKSKTEEDKDDKDTGAQYTNSRPHPTVFFACSLFLLRVLRRQVLPLRSGWRRPSVCGREQEACASTLFAFAVELAPV